MFINWKHNNQALQQQSKMYRKLLSIEGITLYCFVYT